MKKSLLITSIITTIIAFACLCFSFLFFGLYLKGSVNNEGGAKAGGVIFFIIFNFFTLVASGINLIPNIIHFVKCKKWPVLVLFIISMLILLASVGMLAYMFIAK